MILHFFRVGFNVVFKNYFLFIRVTHIPPFLHYTYGNIET